MPGIVGYGAFIPRNRIKSEEIARQWGKDPGELLHALRACGFHLGAELGGIPPD